MCTLETGIVLYFLTQSTLMVLMNLYLNTAKMKKSMGLLEFLPGTKLERLVKIKIKIKICDFFKFLNFLNFYVE